MGECLSCLPASAFTKSIHSLRVGDVDYDPVLQFVEKWEEWWAGRHLVVRRNGCKIDDMYNLGDMLGEGGFGKVHAATSKASGKYYVVKTIDITVTPDLSVLKNEVNLHAELDHPQVVRIHDNFMDDNYLYIVMGLCSGGELTISDNGESEESARHVLRQAMFAVNYLHGLNIVHRDIRPNNFLIQEAGLPLSLCTIKLTDFGMAVRFQVGGPPSLIDVCGTPEYIAPEVAANFRGAADVPYNEMCDIYSCGIFLHELVSGYTPFENMEAELIFDVKVKMRHEILDLSGTEWANVKDHAKFLILRMCEEEPSRRASAGTVLENPWLAKGLATIDEEKDEIPSIVPRIINDEGITELRATFEVMDTGSDGTIDTKESKAALQQHSSLGGEHIEALCQMMDAGGRVPVGYSDFLAAAISKTHVFDEQACHQAFSSIDTDGGGRIMSEELVEKLADGDLTSEVKLVKSKIYEIFGMLTQAGVACLMSTSRDHLQALEQFVVQFR